MKKLFTLVAAVACALAMTAAQYTGQLTVSVNVGDETNRFQQETTITLDENNGTYTFSLKNFALRSEETTLGVGNITLTNLSTTEAAGFKNIEYKDNTEITEGDDPSIDPWLGPDLGSIPLDLFATFNDQVLSVHINIDMTDFIGQVIEVSFTGIDPDAMGGDTSELEAKITELEGKVTELEGQLETAGTEREELTNQINALNEQITALNTELEGYKNLKYGDVNKDNAVTSADISEVVNVIAGLHNEGGE